MANLSLHYYLTTRYAAILVISILLFALSIVYLQFYDMDDTSEYYMQYEAQVLSKEYRSGELIKEFDAGIKEYYWGLDSLPKRYQELIQKEPPLANQINWYQTNEYDIYIYPYQIPSQQNKDDQANKVNEFIVVHLFDIGDYGESFANTRELLTVVSVLLILLIIAAIAWVSQKAVIEISNFKYWLGTLKNNNQTSIVPPRNLNFLEMRQAAEVLVSSINAERELQQQKRAWITREKALLSTLSHELRNPIAIINAAATLLAKRGKLKDKDSETLAKLIKANSKIKGITNALLQLWRKQEVNNPKHEIELATAIEVAINECKQSTSAEIVFVINQEKKTEISNKINTSTELLNILLLNILRNACQYSSDQKVEISLYNQKLTVSNNNREDLAIATTKEDDPDFGYGLGLYLVETICRHQGWKLQIDKSNELFTISVTFSGPL